MYMRTRNTDQLCVDARAGFVLCCACVSFFVLLSQCKILLSCDFLKDKESSIWRLIRNPNYSLSLKALITLQQTTVIFLYREKKCGHFM